MLAVLFAIFAVGIQAGWIGPNDPLAVPLALAFVFLLLVVLLA